jgi:hypothetical protein
MEALHHVLLAGRDGALDAAALAPLRELLAHLIDGLLDAPRSCDLAGPSTLDGGDYIHPVKVAELCALVAQHDGMSRQEIGELALSAILMNAGYVALKRSVLDEPRRLLEGEWEEHVHTHPAQSVTLLADGGLTQGQLAAIAQHHERIDGSGYPDGIRDDEICREARIIAVADTYISLRSMRPYRAALSRAEALELISADAGVRLDERFVEIASEVVSAAGLAWGDVDHRNHFNGPSPEGDGVAPPARGRTEQDDTAYSGARHAHERDEDEASRAERTFERLAAARATAAAPARDATYDDIRANASDVPVQAPAMETRAGVAARVRRRNRRMPQTLFGARLYVDAAANGAWRLDAWPRG